MLNLNICQDNVRLHLYIASTAVDYYIVLMRPKRDNLYAKVVKISVNINTVTRLYLSQ